MPDGRYLLSTPSSGDPAPVLVFLHGYNDTPERWYRQTAVMDAWTDAGFVVILPAGRDRDWNVTNTVGSDRDEVAFLGDVLDDVQGRHALDESRVYLAGHSVGGSMVHDLACRAPERFRGFAPMAGTFWEPLPTGCEGRVVDLRHLHGLADETFPMEGRPIGASMQQGDTGQSLEMWARHDGCDPEPTQDVDGDTTCRVWTGCDGGVDLRLCTHPGGHSLPSGWSADLLEWIGEIEG